MPDDVVQLDDVSVEAQPPYELGLERVSFRLAAGELAVIRIEPDRSAPPLADVVGGVLEPASGRVLFEGQEWGKMKPDDAARARGRIGRVFEQHGWISNLDMDENVTLSQRHHTTRPEEEIAAEADALARRFGLPGVSKVRPPLLKRADRRRSEWVRAFLGGPRLVILERPMGDVGREALPNLLEAVCKARAAGAGVMWITDNREIWTGAAKAASQRLEFRGQGLAPVQGE